MLSGLRRARGHCARALQALWRFKAGDSSTCETSKLPFQHSTCRSTTVLCVRKDDTVLMVADGQVTLGSQVVKPNVKKLRKINDKVLGGYAGTTADAFTLFEALELKLEQFPDQTIRAAVELAKSWRTDKFLRKLEAVLLVADENHLLEITGSGDVLEPQDGVMAIGSGGPYALAAARALLDQPQLDAKAIAEKSMKIAADICIYTNHNFAWEILKIQPSPNPQEQSQACRVPQADGGSQGKTGSSTATESPDRVVISEKLSGEGDTTTEGAGKEEESQNRSGDHPGDDSNTATDGVTKQAESGGDKETSGRKADGKVKKDTEKRSEGTSKKKK